MKIPYRVRLAWATIPDMFACKGLCYDSCGYIAASDIERAIVADTPGGFDIPPVEEAGANFAKEFAALRAGRPSYTCPALDENNRCSVYAVRPAVCRMWGAIDRLPCTHGCMPVGGRRMTDLEARMVLDALEGIDVPTETRVSLTPRP